MGRLNNKRKVLQKTTTMFLFSDYLPPVLRESWIFQLKLIILFTGFKERFCILLPPIMQQGYNIQ